MIRIPAIIFDLDRITYVHGGLGMENRYVILGIEVSNESV